MRGAGRPRRTLLLTVAVLTVVCACSGTSPRPGDAVNRSASRRTASGPPDALAYGPCADGPNWDAAGPARDRRRSLDVRCATLQVPVDHSHPDRGTLGVAVVRVRSTRGHDRIGSLVLNPGGPGGSGLDAMPGWARWFPDELLERFDLVSFDPRGTGSSSPVRCRDLPGGLRDAPPPDLLTGTGLAAAQRLLTARAAACGQALARAGGSYGTDAVARDLDLLRQALGDERLTYVGWSYGARLGAHYAHLFPDRVRALVLDAPPHPTAPWRDVVDAQLDGFERALADYAAGCPARDTSALVAGRPRAVLDRVVATARSAPIPSGRPQHDPPATWDVVLRAVLGQLAAPELWPALDAALSEADRGDSGSLQEMIDSLEGTTPAHPDADADDARSVVLCTDGAPPGKPAALRADAARLVAEHPVLGDLGAWWLFACAAWTAPRAPLPVPTSRTTAPVLVVAGRADPSTPFGGAAALADALGPAAALLESARPGHTSFGRSACVDREVVRLLVDAELPAGRRVCGER